MTERQLELDDLTASMRAAAEDPELIPTLVEEYLGAHAPAAPTLCPPPAEARNHDIAVFWAHGGVVFTILMVFMCSLTLAKHDGWAHQDPAQSWGIFGLYLVAACIPALVWGAVASEIEKDAAT